MDSKPLIFSGSFWAIASMAVTGVEWEKLIEAGGALASGAVPVEWAPVVHAGTMFALALFGVLRVAYRSKPISGIVKAKK